MSSHKGTTAKHVAAGLALLAFVSGASSAAAAGHKVKLKQHLTATSADGDARGAAGFALKGADGKFDVKAARLARDAGYDVVVGGVKVGELHTGRSGGGRIRFTSNPVKGDRLLGFDPRGHQVSVRDGSGDDVLVGVVPDDTIDPTATACCLSDEDGESECEDRTPDACTAAGGTPTQVTSCVPDPCASTPPASVIVCCLNETDDDESETECEDRSEAECAAEGGMVVQATTCDPNPCAPVPPADRVTCCVPDDDDPADVECEGITAEACTARGGTPATATSCEPDPCGGSDDDNGDDGSDGDGDHGDD
jgi:hypothetical protein